jgi:hypothetical protein
MIEFTHEVSRAERSSTGKLEHAWLKPPGLPDLDESCFRICVRADLACGRTPVLLPSCSNYSYQGCCL